MTKLERRKLEQAKRLAFERARALGQPLVFDEEQALKDIKAGKKPYEPKEGEGSSYLNSLKGYLSPLGALAGSVFGPWGTAIGGGAGKLAENLIPDPYEDFTQANARAAGEKLYGEHIKDAIDPVTGEKIPMISDRTPEQIKEILDRARAARAEEAKFLGMQEEMMRERTPQERLFDEFGDVASAGGGVSSYLPLLAGAAGDYLAPGFGGIAGRLGGQLLGSAYDTMSQNAAFGPYAEAARQQFKNVTVPEIAERFAGTGSLGSSSFSNALAQGATDLESQLALGRAQFGQQEQDRAMKMRELQNRIAEDRFKRNLMQNEMKSQYIRDRLTRAGRDIESGLSPRYNIQYQKQQPINWPVEIARGLPRATKTGLELLKLLK